MADTVATDAREKDATEVLEADGRPIAVWFGPDRKLYLLNGWDATQPNATRARAFAARHLGLPLTRTRHLRDLAAHGAAVLDCSPLSLMPEEHLARILDLLDDYRSRPRPPRQNQSEAVCMSVLLGEWVNDVSDPRSEGLARAHPTAQQANALLRDAGYLDEENAPTPAAEAIGVISATWNEGRPNAHGYALYPRARHAAYRDLLHSLWNDMPRRS